MKVEKKTMSLADILGRDLVTHHDIALAKQNAKVNELLLDVIASGIVRNNRLVLTPDHAQALQDAIGLNKRIFAYLDLFADLNDGCQRCEGRGSLYDESKKTLELCPNCQGNGFEREAT